MSDASPVEMVLARLEGVRPSVESPDRQWTALCPAHEDSASSLAIGKGNDGRVLLKCYAGCDAKDVCRAINLEFSDLYPGRQVRKPAEGVTVARLAFEKRLPATFLKGACGLADEGSPGNRYVLIPYRGEDGKELFRRSRFGLRAKDGTRQPKGTKLRPYGLWRLSEFRTAGSRLILVEGESDCWALWHHDYSALGIPGAAAVASLTPEALDGFDEIYAWREPDDAGAQFIVRLSERVPGLRVVSSGAVKDPADLHQRDPDGFKAAFDAILAEAKAEIGTAAAATSGARENSSALTDLGNAKRLVARHGSDLLYGTWIDKWMAWDGTRFGIDHTGEVMRRAKETVRSIYQEAADEESSARRELLVRHATQSESARRLYAMVDLAISEPGIAVGDYEVDCDPMLLNCPNGIVDLTTGELLEHERRRRLTRLCPVPFDPDAKCPIWEKTVALIFPADAQDPSAGGNAELVGYVQRLFGLCLTGRIEAILPIFWGGGSNGKTTVLKAVQEVLGRDYAIQAPHNFLMAKQNDSHPTELARLKGQRFVIATETKQNRRIDEALIKWLTGGERIAAHFMRQDFFEFDPTHKLILCTNHKPRITEADDGIWRRVSLVPFRVRFWNHDRGEFGPDHLRRDKTLPQRLREEYPGILAWMVRGCLKWQESGLGTAPEVEQETAEYRSDEDALGRFLRERVEVGNSEALRLPLKELHETYHAWCEENGESRISSRHLASELRSRGHVVKNGTGNKVVCVGFRLIDNRATTLEDFDD